MKYCENCGAQLEDIASFCNNCGASQQKAAQPNPMYQPTPPPYYAVNNPPRSGKNSIASGVVALVFASLALLFVFIPEEAFWVFCLLFSIPAQACGIPCLVKSCVRKNTAGIIISAIALGLMLLAILLVFAVNGSGSQIYYH